MGAGVGRRVATRTNPAMIVREKAGMTMNRRNVIGAALGLAILPPFMRPARAQEASLYPFVNDHGGQVYNYRLPAEPNLEGLPGILWTGAAAPEVILVEFFDYNCPYCRAASGDLKALLARMPGLRLGLVNNPVLGLGSVQAAKVQQAVLRNHGPAKTLAFHERVFAGHGAVDGPSALSVVAGLGLDAKAIEAAGDLPQVGEVVKRQTHLAAALGFSATPSFMIDGIGMLGYPGPQAMARAVASIRRCDKLACG